ncbi:MAG: 4-hydroxythreonine-4-phosphate dehydrogenase PdxA [Gammaproteobacteria bacterium]|nr:MAG: 4-hydroxythreonine-4-phosphate dehydrogenase PdxA [Gammaproteobacteria bacterium]
MHKQVSRIAVTSGEPAGIGPDLVIELAGQARSAELVVIADPDLLHERALMLGKPLTIKTYDANKEPAPGKPGELLLCPIATATPSLPGQLDALNSPYVLATLDRAATGCLSHEFDAMLTAPVQKSIIAETGINFSGHTEYLAKLCDIELPVMLLCAGSLRVALLTTHLPLSEVPRAITAERIKKTAHILAKDLKRFFGLSNPHIAILGLNPHAGEAGHLGSEEAEIITPTINCLNADNLNLTGPLPADSAFTPASLKQFDAVLAMYHDQGLPVLKHVGFGNAVNVTLGLPIIRTSVDHGTALELAGTGKAQAGSLIAALQMAQMIASRNQP